MRQCKKTDSLSKKSLKIDVNKFIIKYDFDVASKICPMKSGVEYNDNFQQTYRVNALMEVLHECSIHLTNGNKTFLAMYTLDGILIKDLMKIPESEKILLVSETIPNLDEYEDGLEKAFVTGVDPKFKQKTKVQESQDEIISFNTEQINREKVPVQGLKNNIYQFKNAGQINNYKTTRVEKAIDRTKEDWMKMRYRQWEDETPYIYQYHREAD